MLQVKYLVPLFIGTLIGVVGGALPGITITMTVIMVLPFTFGLEPLQGLAVHDRRLRRRRDRRPDHLVPARHSRQALGGGDDVRRLPDGAEGRAGQGAVARHLGLDSSAGCSARVLLVGATGPLAELALEFGPWEYFALFVLALSMVAGPGRAPRSPRGCSSGAIGCVVTVLGNDPVMGQPRLTLGIAWLEGGMPFLPVLIGVFAFAQIMGEHRADGRRRLEPRAGYGASSSRSSHAKVLWEILSRPGPAAVVDVHRPGDRRAAGDRRQRREHAWPTTRRRSSPRQPEKFGTGMPEGIIASEASNNANVAGSLVTIMAFGIPGDAVTAVMLGALTIHGIQSGPLFISQKPTLAYGMFAAYILAHSDGADPASLGVRWVLRIVIVPKSMLFPVVLVLCVVGAYALGNTMANGVRAAASAASSATLMVKFGLPLAPFILGVILGDQIEINLVRSLMTDANLWLFVTRPISALLLGAAVASIALSLWQHRRMQKKSAVAGGAADF